MYKLPVLPGFTVIGELTSMQIAIGHKGSRIFRVHFHSNEAHSMMILMLLTVPCILVLFAVANRSILCRAIAGLVSNTAICRKPVEVSLKSLKVGFYFIKMTSKSTETNP